MALLAHLRWRQLLQPVIGVVIGLILVAAAPGARSGPAATPAASPVATPSAPATPVAAGCGNNASSPTEIAEVFVAAASRMDLERAARCFAPDQQPDSWDEVFLGGQAGMTDDVSGCRGIPYTVTESKLRSDFSAIIFVFDRACVVASLDDWQRDLYDAETLAVTTLVAQVYERDDRWYVQDALALVPD